MAVPRVRMFAGPNGSGKTSLIQSLKSKDIPLGSILNADELLERIEKSGYLDLKEGFAKQGVILSRILRISMTKGGGHCKA